MPENTFYPEPKLGNMWHLLNAISFIFLMAVPAFLLLIHLNLWIGLSIAALFILIFLCLAFYIPAFFKTLEYSLDSDAVRLKKGVFWRRRTSVPYDKITNIDITQGPVERMFGLSQLHVQTAGSSGQTSGVAELVISGISDCEALKNTIMSHIGKRGAQTPTPPDLKPDQNIMQAILTELSAIRKHLENRDNH